MISGGDVAADNGSVGGGVDVKAEMRLCIEEGQADARNMRAVI